MKLTITRRQILEIGISTSFLTNIIQAQNRDPEGLEKAGFKIALPNKTMYRIGRNMDKIQKAFDRIADEEKTLLEKHKAEFYKGRLVRVVEKPKKPSPKAKKEEKVYLTEEEAKAFYKDYDEFLDDEKSKEEFDFMELTEDMFVGGHGLTWDNFFKKYAILIKSDDNQDE